MITHSSIVFLPGNPMDRGAWWTTVHSVSKSWTGVKRLSAHTHNATAKSLQSYPTLCNPIDSSPSGFPGPGILQARILEWIAIFFSNTHNGAKQKHWNLFYSGL